MSIYSIHGLVHGPSIASMAELLGKKAVLAPGYPAPIQEAPGPEVMDRLELSPRARTQYAREAPSTEGDDTFADRFMEALEHFTDYALHLNGYAGQGNGKEAYLALQVLAQKSGLRLPGNLVDNKDAVLSMFKEQWGLDEGADARTIFDHMVRVFGEDRSYGEPGPGAAPPERGMPPADHPFDSSGGSPFREALTRFTAGLFEAQGIEHVPRGEDLERVLNLLAEKLGLEPSDGSLSQQVMAALGLDDKTGMGTMLSALERAFAL